MLNNRLWQKWKRNVLWCVICTTEINGPILCALQLKNVLFSVWHLLLLLLLPVCRGLLLAAFDLQCKIVTFLQQVQVNWKCAISKLTTPPLCTSALISVNSLFHKEMTKAPSFPTPWLDRCVALQPQRGCDVLFYKVCICAWLNGNGQLTISSLIPWGKRFVKI